MPQIPIHGDYAYRVLTNSASWVSLGPPIVAEPNRQFPRGSWRGVWIQNAGSTTVFVAKSLTPPAVVPASEAAAETHADLRMTLEAKQREPIYGQTGSSDDVIRYDDYWVWASSSNVPVIMEPIN